MLGLQAVKRLLTSCSSDDTTFKEVEGERSALCSCELCCLTSCESCKAADVDMPQQIRGAATLAHARSSPCTGGYHELLLGPEKDDVVVAIRDWLLTHSPTAGPDTGAGAGAAAAAAKL